MVQNTKLDAGTTRVLPGMAVDGKRHVLSELDEAERE